MTHQMDQICVTTGDSKNTVCLIPKEQVEAFLSSGHIDVSQLTSLELSSHFPDDNQLRSLQRGINVKNEPGDPMSLSQLALQAAALSGSTSKSKSISSQRVPDDESKSAEDGTIPSYWAMNWESALAGNSFPQMQELNRINTPKETKSAQKKNAKTNQTGQTCTTDRSRSMASSARGQAPNYCQVCSEQFPSDETYKLHMKQHKRTKSTRYVDGERSSKAGYRCNLCNQTFSAGYTLKKHIRVHTREKPFSCDLCSERFSQWGNLRLHIQRHLGINPYRCPYCDKAYIAPSKLEVHIRGHTNERPYPCEICYSTFKSNDDLRKHMMIHANYKPFTCWLCHKSFMQPSKLKQHMKEKHMMDVDISKKDVTDKGVEYEIKILPGED